MVASQFGRVLKVDEHTLDRSRAKFARVCVDLDLAQPLQQGTWLKYGDFSVFVLVLYEKLPVFCFRCGRVGHAEANCPFADSHLRSGSHVPSVLAEKEPVHAKQGMQVDEVDNGHDDIAIDPSPPIPETDCEFGPWLKPRQRHTASRSRGGSHGGSRGGTRNPNPGGHRGDDEPDTDTWPPAWSSKHHVADDPSPVLATWHIC